VFSNEVFKKVAGEETLEHVSRIRKEARHYIPEDDFKKDTVLAAIFRPVVTDLKLISSSQIYDFAEYQKEVIKVLAPALSGDTVLALELEFAREYYRSINLLQGIGLEVLPLTYIRLLDQLLGSVSVPFRGEPLKGLQIMGPLETRALDFKDVVVLSANEGVFPRRSVS
jgi:inactivated superfamily I helicase